MGLRVLSAEAEYRRERPIGIPPKVPKGTVPTASRSSAGGDRFMRHAQIHMAFASSEYVSAASS